ncbi:MAG: hypothetical protein OHK0011_04110 [Turneriella sp.]
MSLLPCLPIRAQELIPGQAYELELTDGSRLNGAVYRGQEAGVDSFELATVVGRVRLKEYRIVQPPKQLSWMLALAPGLHLPLNQKELGFSHGVDVQLAGNIPLFKTPHFALPRLAVVAGFARYSGSKALLYGPDVTAGPGWLIPLGHGQRWFALLHLTAGAAFYELLNVNLNQTFSQTTFLAAAEMGLGLRLSQWGVMCSFAQSFLFDEKLPLVSGGIRISAVYFGGKV